MSILKPFLTVSGFTLLSRVFGFVRDILLAAIMGAGPLMEIFVVAFKLPNFFRRLFAEGAFNAAFVPMYSTVLAKEGEGGASRFSSSVLAVLLVVLVLFTVAMQLAMPWVLQILAPGFVGDEEKFGTAVYLCRVTFPYLILISLVSLLTGILNSMGRFAPGAFVPVLFNICLISALLMVGYFTTTPAHILSYALIIAGVVQLIWMIRAAAKAGILPRLQMPHITPEVKTLLKRMVPGIVGGGIVQINLWVDILIGTMIPSAIAYLYYADRLSQLPLAIVGTAVGIAILPMLSKQFENGDKEKALRTQNKAIELAMFFTMPAAVALMVMAYPLVSTLFERGEFGADAAHATGHALVAYALGLPAFVLIKVLTPGFFAVGDTKTPVKYAIIALITNIILNISFIIILKRIGIMPHIGIALATSIAAWLNSILLGCKLLREGRLQLDNKIWRIFVSISGSAVICGVALFVAMKFLPEFSNEGESGRITTLGILIIAGAGSYFISLLISRAYTMSQLKQVLRAR